MLPREDGLIARRILPYQLHTAPIGKGVIDRDLRVVEVNETLASFDGASIHDSIGCAVSRVMPTLAPTLEPLLQQVFASGKPLVDVEAQNEISARGTARHWRVSCFPVQTRSGMVLAVDVMVQELPPTHPESVAISPRTPTNGNTGSPLQLIVEVADWDDWEWNTSPPPADAPSDGLCSLAPGTFAGTFDSFIAFVYPDDRQQIGQIIDRASHEDTHYTIEFRIVLPNGIVRWLAANGCWIDQPLDQPPYLLGVVTDITERKHAEQTLDRLLESEPSVRSLIQQATARWQRLYDLIPLFSGSLTSQHVANALMNHAKKVLGASGSSLGLLNQDASALVLISVDDPLADEQSTALVPINTTTPFSEAVRTGRPNWLHSKLELVTRYPNLPLTLEHLATGACVHVPLRIQQHIIGVLALHFAAPRVFSQDDRAFVLALAEQCALALDRARLYDAVAESGRHYDKHDLYAAEHAARTNAERNATRLERLHLVTASLAQALTPDQVARVIVEQSRMALGARAGTVGLLVDDGTTLETLGSIGFSSQELASWSRIPMAQSTPITDVVRSGVPILLSSPAAWCAAYPHLADAVTATNDHTWAAIPLLIEGSVLGGIALRFAEPREFDDEDRAWMGTLAQQCAQALERARLYAAEQHARQAAEAALRMRDEVVALVSHDLKNPLTAIMGRAYHAQRRLAATPPALEGVASGLEMIGALAERMSMQIEDLLDLARLRAGTTLDLQRNPVELVALVQQLAAESRQATDQHRIIVASAVPELTGRFDGLRLERVIRNLLDNALKYSPNGGTISLKVAREIDATGDWAVLTVRDHGVGIPADDLPHVFERFHRASNVTEHIAGTGLGLASVRQIIEQHGGTITVTSKLGKGTTFTVRLPLT